MTDTRMMEKKSFGYAFHTQDKPLLPLQIDALLSVLYIVH